MMEWQSKNKFSFKMDDLLLIFFNLYSSIYINPLQVKLKKRESKLRSPLSCKMNFLFIYYYNFLHVKDRNFGERSKTCLDI